MEPTPGPSHTRFQFEPPRRVAPLDMPRRSLLPRPEVFTPQVAIQPPRPVPAQPSAPNPNAPLRYISDSDLAVLRVCLPALKDLSDELLKSLDMSALVNLNNSATQKAPDMSSAMAAAAAAAQFSNPAGAHHDPGIKMALTLEALQANPSTIKAGQDDRISVLHEGRFLPGTVASTKKQWLQGRDIHGLDGIAPLATYDLSSIGLGGSVTNQGWKYLHNPGSRNINLNMFSPINMSTSESTARKFTLADNDGSVCIGENLKEIIDMDTFYRAIRALCAAGRLAMPWNYSFAAIEGFLQASNYGGIELANRPDRAAVLVRFVNYVLGVNAVNYQQKEPFLNTGDLLKEFSSWCATQVFNVATLSTSQNFNFQQNTNRTNQTWNWKQKKSGQNQPQAQQAAAVQTPAQMFTVPPPALGQPAPATTNAGAGAGGQPSSSKVVCKRYNTGTCPNHFSGCFLKSGTKAYHICSAIKSNGAMCGSYHPATNHK